jgi:hypothetical protein
LEAASSWSPSKARVVTRLSALGLEVLARAGQERRPVERVAGVERLHAQHVPGHFELERDHAGGPLHVVAGNNLPLVLASLAVASVVLGALYMLRFALGLLYGTAKAPHQPLVDLDRREKTILGLISAGSAARPRPTRSPSARSAGSSSA